MTKIYLIRHGKSTANVDETVYFNTFDHLIPLSPLGIEQAAKAGKKLEHLIQRDLKLQEVACSGLKPKFSVFCSPYKRTIQTWENINLALNDSFVTSNSSEISSSLQFNDGEFEEAPLLREQEHKGFLKT